MRRIATWLIFGPVGHLLGGVLDWLELLARHWWLRTRRAASPPARPPGTGGRAS